MTDQFLVHSLQKAVSVAVVTRILLFGGDDNGRFGRFLVLSASQVKAEEVFSVLWNVIESAFKETNQLSD